MIVLKDIYTGRYLKFSGQLPILVDLRDAVRVRAVGLRFVVPFGPHGSLLGAGMRGSRLQGIYTSPHNQSTLVRTVFPKKFRRLLRGGVRSRV